MAKGRKRSEKGEVSLWVRGDKLWLRWRVEGRQYQLSLHLDDSPINQFRAQEVANKIKTDIAYGKFDPARKEEYRPILRSADSAIDLKPHKPSTVELFEAFIEHRRQEGTSGQAISSRYIPMLSNLKRFKRDVDDEATARQFVDLLRSRQSPLIANQNLAMLKSFADWAVLEGKLESNSFSKIRPLKVDKSQSREKPFTHEEIIRFLETIKTDRYYAHYHDFCMTLFHLGLRPSECIGLRWKHIDFSRHQITICESLSRSPEGKTAGYVRERKGLKTSDSGVSFRVLDLTPKLFNILLQRKPVDVHPDALIFPAPGGGPIDDRSFSQRCWKNICQKAGIEYRSPYNARHSLISHLIEAGATLPQAAYVAGHRDIRQVAETYGHMVSRPKMIDF